MMIGNIHTTTKLTGVSSYSCNTLIFTSFCADIKRQLLNIMTFATAIFDNIFYEFFE